MSSMVDSFDKLIFKFDANSGDEVPFEFNYVGNDKLLGVTPSCGCTEVKVDGNRIYGVYSATSTENFIQSGKLPGSVQVGSSRITVWFDDGEPFKTVKDGIIKDNPNKSKYNLQIRGNVTVLDTETTEGAQPES